MPGLREGATYCDLVLAALRRFPDRIAFKQDRREVSYRELVDLLARWVTLLHERGLRPGEGIGVLSGNRPEVWLGQSAPALVGGRFTALHPMGSFDDHLYACEEAELRFLLVDPAYAERAAALLEKSNAVEEVLTFGPSDVGRDITELAQQVRPARLDRGPHGPDDVAWLLYTGGTTGVPKAAMLAERAVAQQVYSVLAGWDLPQRDVRYLAVTPISHAAGLLTLPVLSRGGTVILHSRFDPDEWLQTVATERVTLALLVPTVIYVLLDHPELDRSDLSSLETVMYGAAPISPTRLAQAIERIGPVFCQLYGQTESTGVGTCLWRDHHDPSDLHRLGSCGTAMPGVRVEVLDDDARPLPDGEPGEICVQGASVMDGYWKQPELTEPALAGGWLHTGDVAIRDEEGFLYIVDRKKDMIISGGFNVFPREVEDVLVQHADVAAAAVIAVPDPKWGEAVKAVVVPRPGTQPDEAELIALVKDRKGPVYAPKSVDFVEAIPLTPVGKADKKALRARY